MTQVSMRVDEDIKVQAEALFNDIGLTMTTAFNLFLRAAIREQKIPFELSRNTNAGAMATVDELQAIKEFEDNYEENSKFVNVDDLKKRINMMLEGV
ncbi:MAG: type II toxin-antitoxin system RelB/DinJ family antitoxin [Defluviitaleaceae bacterium]|nr:type II toxin-antitoxin system RelB/DinJ family antitoxin [Defluviitaleaceae bacterium]